MTTATAAAAASGMTVEDEASTPPHADAAGKMTLIAERRKANPQTARNNRLGR